VVDLVVGFVGGVGGEEFVDVGGGLEWDDWLTQS